MTKENYMRMVVLSFFLFDYSSLNVYEISKPDLRNQILITLTRLGMVENMDIAESIIQFYYPENKTYTAADFYIQLQNISKELLTYHNNRLCIDMFETYHFDESQTYAQYFNNKVLDYLELSKLLSDTSLIAMYNYYHHYDINYCLERKLLRPISVVNHQLESVLKKGIAETHIHVVGSIPFDTQWQWLNSEIYNNNPNISDLLEMIDKNESVIFQMKRTAFQSPIAVFILHTIIIRLLLMLQMHLHICGGIKQMMIQLQSKMGTSNQYLLLECIRAIDDIKVLDKLRIRNLMGLVNNLFQILREKRLLCASNAPDELFSDKLHRSLVERQKYTNLNEVNAHIEYIMNYMSIEYLNHNKQDEFFKKMYLFYIRAKNIIHGFIVESNDIKGFLEFQYFFSRQKVISDTPSIMFDSVFRTYLYENVKYLEIRVGHVRLENNVDKNAYNYPREINRLRLTFYNTVYKFLEAYESFLKQHPYLFEVPQAGLILHFNKRNDTENKCWEDYLRIEDDSLIRYKAFQEECFLNLIVFEDVRNELPYGEDYLIGIDGASNELLAEPWVLAPVFRSVKERYAHILKNKNLELDAIHSVRRKELGITYHVGEVFRTIISGLRHVDEVLDYYGFQNGERIGHGTILGISIEDYLNHHQVVYVPAIELLDNLLWLYHLKSNKNLFQSISSSFFEEKIWNIVHFIYNNAQGHLDGNISLHHLYMSYRKQFEELSSIKDLKTDHNCNQKRMAAQCVFSSSSEWDEDLLFLTRHCRCFLEKMTRFIKVDLNQLFIKEIYMEAQEYMIRKISHSGIIVETNPVSNLTIGEVYELKKHPIFSLNNAYKENTSKVMVSINTDDPGVFSTSLRNQFGFIQQMLYDMNVPMEDALKWIDTVRENGMSSAFMNKSIKSREQILDELEQMLKFIERKISD